MNGKPVTSSITINAPSSKVWHALTDISLISQWMSETEMNIDTDWGVGNSIVFQGRWHKMKYRNAGKVLRFDPGRVLSYSHLSSLSRLPDLPENHSVITFQLTPQDDNTVVELTLSDFPTFEIQKHLEFYWRVTLGIFKEFVERA
jgi:uncharacterized protein YndB with AHSA1/START domain